MPKNRLAINHFEDLIQLSWQRGEESLRLASPVHFAHPFDKKALDELRWYLEEYLLFPYGIEPDKAAEVEQKLQIWGQQLFELIFRSSEKARQFFQAATYEGLDKCELSISSDLPEVLNLPWELLYSPDDRNFLAPSLAQMYRSLNSQPVRAEMKEIKEEKLNILLVIARPYGEKDISFQTVARPMLEALQPIQEKVNLKVLRPPSFEEFEREINDNKGFYHIIHFDGHGDFDPNSAGLQYQFGEKAGQGFLVFETEDGSPQKINAAQIAQNLTDCNVPIFILNACKSAKEGEESFSSVATRLVALGAKGVVAMAYSVYALGAKHFIGRLYKQLVRGDSLGNAVAAGRREMLNQKLRPSPKDNLPLQDWLVPVLYQQENYTPFHRVDGTQEDFSDLDQFLNESQPSNLIDLPEEGTYGFVGRDYDILRLERAFRLNNFVLLQGMGGTGKTQLACGFARWLEKTQGRGGQIFFTSFEHGAGLSQFVHQVGRNIWGDKFSQYSLEQQKVAVQRYLKTQPCLFIWDNLEAVAGFPAGNKPLLSLEEQGDLKRFLKTLRGGQSWVLITSRQEEQWLDCGYTLLSLQGLRQQDAEELAKKILRRVDVDVNILQEDYITLLKLLRGCPLSLQVVLPHLKKNSPQEIIEALRYDLEKLDNSKEKTRNNSIQISLHYSYSQLSEKAKNHLPFLALFSGGINLRWLSGISNGDAGKDLGKIYKSIFRENIRESDWQEIINEASKVGLTEHLELSFYRVHPVLPGFLRDKLSLKTSNKKINKLEEELLYLYKSLAQSLVRKLIKEPSLTRDFVVFEEQNLLRNFNLALQKKDWDVSRSFLSILIEIYGRLERRKEIAILFEQALKQVGRNTTVAKHQSLNTFEFWRYLKVEVANNLVDKGDLEAGKSIHQEIIKELYEFSYVSDIDKITIKQGIKISTMELALIARVEREFELAKTYIEESLEFDIQYSDLQNMANCYRELGIIYCEQDKINTSNHYYKKSSKIFEHLGDLYSASSLYYELAGNAIKQGECEEAKIWLFKSLTIRQELKDWAGLANVDLALGKIAAIEREYGLAKTHYNNAIKVYEDLENFERAAYSCYDLGTISNANNDTETSISYYLKAVDFLEMLGWEESYIAANIYNSLAIILENKAFEIELDANDYDKAAEQCYFLSKDVSRHEDWYLALKLYTKSASIFMNYQERDDSKQIDEIHSIYQSAGKIAEFLGVFEIAVISYFWGLITGISRDKSMEEETFIPNSVDIENLGWMLYQLGESDFKMKYKELVNRDFPDNIMFTIRKVVVEHNGNIETQGNDIKLFLLRIERYRRSNLNE